MSVSQIRVRRAVDNGDFRHATAIVHDLVDWIRSHMHVDLHAEQPSLDGELADLAGRYGDRFAAMFLAYVDDVAVGAVAVRCHDDGTAELKRMFVRPLARGSGAADALVRQAIAFAREAQCRQLWLETARGAMDPAIAVYRRHGFDVAGDPSSLDIPAIVVMRRQLEPEPCHA